MGAFKNGVRWYTTATAAVKVAFPEGEVYCRWCPHCKPETALERFRCHLTGKMIYNPSYMGLPDGCPLVIDKEEHYGDE